MFLSTITAHNFRHFGTGTESLSLSFNSGVTALVGRNDSGKSAVIDAIRYVLLTRDQDYIRIQPEDFHIDSSGKQAEEILIRCKLSGLDDHEKGAFAEYLSFEAGQVSLLITWAAKRLSDLPISRRWVEVSVRTGTDGSGPPLEASVRELLATAYLRPLRDAEREMASGRGSRLSQILANVPEILEGEIFDDSVLTSDPAAVSRLSLLGLSDYMRHIVKHHKAIANAQEAVNSRYLSSFSLAGDILRGEIDPTEGGSERARLRQILERLELSLLEGTTGQARGRYGLGSNNLLFMACELLLLGRQPQGMPLLLIEEPEAHLHPQRQLRLMQFLTSAAMSNSENSSGTPQIILTTHSPNLSSKIPLENIVLLDGGCAFPLRYGHTRLDRSDYRFLSRFLDVTKANLFFAHGVIVVEGDAEAILLPVLAQLVGVDLTQHGVSIVNVGGKGLRRFSRVFQRSEEGSPALSIPVACVTDFDVLPDCAPAILGLVASDQDEVWRQSRRRWKALRDFGNSSEEREAALSDRRVKLQSDDAGPVRTFVADHWTLEYDLAYAGLAEEVFVAAQLAMNDDPLNQERKKREDVQGKAQEDFQLMSQEAGDDKALLCSMIYKLFHSGCASKAVAAQYLSERLEEIGQDVGFDRVAFSARLPKYILDTIEHIRCPSPPGSLSRE